MLRSTVILLAAGMVLAAPAVSVELQWAPADTLLRSGDQATLSVMLPDSIDVRTVELRVSYDPAVVTTVDGGFGELFTGFQRFTDFVEEAPGQWYGYCVILGAEDWASGPGELFRWTVEAGSPGAQTVVAATTVTLIAPGSEVYDGTSLADAMLRVSDGTTAADTPERPTRLTIHPNPFNPRTTVRLVAPESGSGVLEVFDLRGRRIATPWSGQVTGGVPFDVSWDGLDDTGRAVPSGTYAFRYFDGTRTATVRGTLTR